MMKSRGWSIVTRSEKVVVAAWKTFGNLLTYTLLIKTSKYQIFIIHVNILKKLAFKDWFKHPFMSFLMRQMLPSESIE